MPLEKHWLGPTKKLWGLDQCSRLADISFPNGLIACKRECNDSNSCNAIIFKKLGSSQFSCDLRDCDSPVPEPTSYTINNMEGYYIATGKNQIYI